MKVVILAGGFGTRISEESQFKPKPMVDLGGIPILLHIMKLYSHYGFNDFIICAGYKQHVIKEYFADYFLHTSDITYDFTGGKNEMIVHHTKVMPWRVTVADTGLNTMTGGRVKRIREYVGNEPFMLTYGDGVSDVNIRELVAFHKAMVRWLQYPLQRPHSVLACLISQTTATSVNSAKRIRTTVTSSTSATWYASRNFSIISTATKPYLRKSR